MPLNLLLVSEVATELRLSKMSVYRIIWRGELPALQMGRSFRVRREDLDSYIKRSEREPAEKPL